LTKGAYYLKITRLSRTYSFGSTDCGLHVEFKKNPSLIPLCERGKTPSPARTPLDRAVGKALRRLSKDGYLALEIQTVGIAQKCWHGESMLNVQMEAMTFFERGYLKKNRTEFCCG
jgi:hypothetical protein